MVEPAPRPAAGDPDEPRVVAVRFVPPRFRPFRLAAALPLADAFALAAERPVGFGWALLPPPPVAAPGLRLGRLRLRRFFGVPELPSSPCDAGVPVGSSVAMTCGY